MVREEQAVLQAPQGFRASWQRLSNNPHVRAEFGALMVLAFAIATLEGGLRIAPVVCATIAIAIVGMDIGDWLHERR